MSTRDERPAATGRAGAEGAASGRHALLAGGGTGGHVFPALAVADELLAGGWRVSFTGAPASLEARLAAERGLPFHPLAARPLLGRGMLARMAALATAARSGAAAARLIRALGADVVLGTGGYVSAPAVVGARLARRPVLLLEPNAHAGVANRWLSHLATAAAVAYRETGAELRCPATITGVPVRREFFAVPPLDIAPAGAPEVSPVSSPATGALLAVGPRLLVLGGSQGARQINQALPAAAARLLAAVPGLTVLHQAGQRQVEETREAYVRAGLGRELAAAGDAGGGAEGSPSPAGARAAAAGTEGPRIAVVPFLRDMAGAMAESSLVLSRAGAITVAEICAAGRPALLVPLAIARGHQVGNARLVAAAGGAEVLEAADLAPEPFAARIAALLADRERLARMGRAARTLAHPGAAAAIAGRLGELAAAGPGGGRGEGRR
jgi:UDP-N-acetylglucosamine--N-acetylmuramyl-(pentapeptide) pyrophosphoryl-undecaprenol N-acetylglucosamine transferase